MTETEEFEFRARLEREQAPQAARNVAPETRPWSDVAATSVGNIPSSALEFGKGIVQSAHPIDTGRNLLKLGQGAAVNAMPDAYIKFLDRVNPGLAAKRGEVSDIASAVGGMYKRDYGSVEGFKNKLSNDPVGLISDASAVLSLGAGGAGKIPALNKAITVAGKTAPSAASILGKAAQYTNPVNLLAKPLAMSGNLAANVVSAFGTHTGSMPIKQAFKSGFEGGASSKNFRQNMRGQVPMTDVLEAAKENVRAMGQAKSAEYRAGMAQVSGDKSVLVFDGIDDALKSASGIVTYKGQIKNERAARAVQEISDEVAKWRGLDPAEFHTPEGLDALKQKIGAITEGIPFEEKTARMVAGNIRNAVKDTIVKQAPIYAKTMEGYAAASDELYQIEKALGTGSKTSVDTAMRKLQSLTRNNVNTNYGNRLDLARTLEQKGGNELMPALAGQALNNWAPRGLGGTIAGGVGLGGYAVGGLPLAAAALVLQSPRLVGETAFKLGQAGGIPAIPLRYMKGKGLDPATIANIMAQLGKIPQ